MIAKPVKTAVNKKFTSLVFLNINVLLLCFFNAIPSQGQNPYFVYFKNKSNSTYSINKPGEFLSDRSIKRRTNQNIKITERDLPVNVSYLTQLKSAGAIITGSSKWLNAALITCNETQLEEIKKLSIVSGIEGNTNIKGLRYSTIESKQDKFGIQEDYNYGNSLSQIQQLGADLMHKKGYTGKNILIGVFDSGFQNVDKIDAFKHVFDNKKILMTYDFVDNETNVYNDHSHGTQVLSCISSNLNGTHVGTAPDATLVLFRTEDVSSETKIEEVYWLLAAEKADSIGVNVINSSLGYYTFDNPLQNYTYSDMNGDKTISARAADYAVGTGMMVVCSAGNEGNGPWRYIITPADADSVISVGAVDANANPSGFSSFGPNAKGSIKPELAARGSLTSIIFPSNTIGSGNGTSFSSPLIAGFFASLMQAYPTLSVMKLRELLIKSGSKYNNPDTRVGYGIPSFVEVEKLVDQYLLSLVMSNHSEVENQAKVYPNPVNEFSKISINGVEIDEKPSLSLFDLTGKHLSSDFKYKDFGKILNQHSGTSFYLLVKTQDQSYYLKIVK